MIGRCGWIYSLLVLAVLLGGCASSESITSSPSESLDLDADAVDRDLRTLAAEWEGTPYRLGGTSPRGIDCSGFTEHAFDKLFGMDLPRTTDGQVQQGRTITTQELQPGDLVFFRPTNRKQHVGIYLSDGEFVHASTSEGVTVSALDNAYWQRRYWTARRILSDQSLAASDAEENRDNSPTDTPPPSRPGW